MKTLHAGDSSIAIRIIRLAIIALLLITLLQKFTYLAAETEYQRAKAAMGEIQFRRSTDYDGLLDQVASASTGAPITNAYSKLVAHSLALVRRNDPTNNRVSRDDLIRAYRLALKTTPLDGYLWANLAAQYSAAGEQAMDYHYALSRALKYGSHDYNTMRNLVTLGLGDWPYLDCTERTLMLGVVKRSLAMDDVIVSVRNGSLGLNSLKQYTAQSIERVGFNVDWARNQVRRCKSS